MAIGVYTRSKYCKRGHLRSPENLTGRVCKQCLVLWHKQHPDKRKRQYNPEVYARWYAKHGKQHYRKNKQRLSNSHAAYYKKNASEICARIKVRRAQHPEVYSAALANKTARRFGFTERITAAQLKALYKHFGNRCLCCGSRRRRLTPDHVMPLCKGGRNHTSNLQPLCRPCNVRKNQKCTDYRNRRTL